MVMMVRFISFLAGLLLTLSGLLLTPASLIAVGIMDRSLQSDVALTRETALLEVELFKWGLMIVGALTVLGTAIWPVVERTGPVQRFEAKDWSHPPAYEEALARVWDRGLTTIVVLVALSFFYLTQADRYLSASAIAAINREDGLIEYASALLLIGAAALAAAVALKGSGRRTLRGFHAFLALLFLVMCGEEISWGQRIIGFGTPESIEELNVQQEVNFHNMFGYLFDHLFILCFFIWGCVLPLLYAVSPLMRDVLRSIGLPLPSRGMAIGMLLVTLYQDEIVFGLIESDLPALRLPEIREFLSATAFFLMMLLSATCLIPKRSSHAITAGRQAP